MPKFDELCARFVERHKVLGTSMGSVATVKELRDWYTDLQAALEQDKTVKGQIRKEWRRKFKLELKKIETFFAKLDQEAAEAKAEIIH